LGAAAWAVSTLPEWSVNAALEAIALRDDTDATAFAERGMDHVVRPYDDAANFAAREIGQTLARQRNSGPLSAAVE